MTKDLDATRRRAIREKSVIDHLARDLYKPRPPADQPKPEGQKPTTDTGLSVEDQVRKEWDPRNGGLPIFLV